MTKIHMEQYPRLAKLLTDCFFEDRLVSGQIRGIEEPEIFLEKLFLMQIPVFDKTCEMNTLDDNLDSLIIGYEKKKFNQTKLILLSIFYQLKFRNELNGSDLKIYKENGKAVLRDLDLKWYKEFIKGNYYYIKAIAIKKGSRGKGVFRQLITPVVDYCNENSLPIILETNTSENVPVYRHFGFELVKTIKNKGGDFCQYCLIRKPETGQPDI
ncbi:MAG: GNAT family N-acetyltransferase [Clostridiales bacterium]|nr:GNAT family N-acetyltransferase [Clostridiales bacterium]